MTFSTIEIFLLSKILLRIYCITKDIREEKLSEHKNFLNYIFSNKYNLFLTCKNFFFLIKNKKCY